MIVKSLTDMKALRKVVSACVLSAAISACTSPYRAEVVDIESHVWDQPVEILWDNVDTLHTFDWQFFMRCSDRKNGAPFTVQIQWQTPDSLQFSEELSVQNDESPVAASLMRDVTVEYRRDVRLSRAGLYRIRLTPDQSVHGVVAVGLQSAAVEKK